MELSRNITNMRQTQRLKDQTYLQGIAAKRL